jgi:serine/threonine protein kinase
MPPAGTLRCLTDDTVADFVTGALRSEQLTRVDEHLADCVACQELVGAAAAAFQGEPSDVPSSPWAALASMPAPGELIAGKYRIVRVLGQGGMGVVLAADDLELGQRVALKVLCSSEATAAPRFLREARVCARLVDEHIVRVSDLGLLSSGVPFLVMEHLEGETLQQRVARGPLPIAEAIEYVRQACSGLIVAHAAGVMHRDLKPSNLFLVPVSSGKARLKILDFGLSKAVGVVKPDTTLTLPRTLLGSPLYMSPEQVLGSRMDARTDVWSLGVILYELVTQRKPFNGRTLPELLLAIATRTPPGASSFVADMPEGLDALLVACLEKDVAARTASAKHLLAALESVQSALPASARID